METTTALQLDLAWFESVLAARLSGDTTVVQMEALLLSPPLLDDAEGVYAHFVRHYEMSVAERLLLLLALIPHVQPQLLDPLFQLRANLNRGYTEFGGVQGKMHGGFLPTAETALYLLAGADIEQRFALFYLFDSDHFFSRHNMLKLEPVPYGEPLMSGQLVISSEVVDLITIGQIRKPDFSRSFPAKLITTEMDWDDLVLSPYTREQLNELKAWIEHEDTLMQDWGMAKHLRPGYKCLFYGPPGTGKTLTATLLGKRFDYDVYRVSLSTVISKYIGETEKNLEQIFQRTEHMRCILFFDEADALFGKRTSISDAHDRYANQEIAYLLQRIEDYPGVAILASNFRSNLDDAFMRRFQAVIHFPMPTHSERKSIWQQSFSDRVRFDDGVSMQEIAGKYELSGGAIMNVVRYVSLMALDEGSDIIKQHHLVNGIRRELQKEGKSI